MSKVHCLECGRQVIVDPRGQCPDGHTVGTAGNRIEMAMGHESAHPEEPDPWVYRIEPTEVDDEAEPSGPGPSLRVADAVADGRTNGSGPAREARPVRAPGLPQGDEDDEPADAESLLRELHSLAALDTALTQRNADRAADGHAAAGPPATPPPPPPQAAAPTPRPPRGDPEEIADAFAELSALDLPASSSNGHRAASTAPTARETAGQTPPTPPSEVAGAGGRTAADELSSLFGDGALFGQDDQLAASEAAAPAAPSTPSPSSGPADRSVPPDASAAPNAGDDAQGLELEAMFQTAEAPPAAPEPARARRRSRAGEGSSSEADARSDVPPAVELRPRRSATPPAQGESEGETDAQPVHAVAGSAQVLDLSSFTAKGGPGAGRSTGRRRRFGR